MIDLKASPFFLKDEDIQWVEETLSEMTLEEKVGHLFCPVGLSPERDVLKATITKYKPAGFMFRPAPSHEVQEIHRFLQQNSKLPLLIASNLENGGNGTAVDGTEFGTNMQIGATGDVKYAKALASICATEGSAVGCNWSFAPVVDIDFNPENPITNVRTYGSNAEIVSAMSKGYIEELQSKGMAATAKHFPGDGIDHRDQHIAMTFNTLSCEEWDKTYGEVYRSVIESGALSIMSGHMSLPSYSRFFNPELTDEELMPASLSPELLQGLLRERLKFNGVIVSDATAMVGFTTAMPRHLAVPTAIKAGCDIFLFNKDLAEDFQFMLEGIENGVLSMDRVHQAITRTLAMKAALGLHKKQKEDLVGQACALEVIGCDSHKQMAKECAEESVTLVKNKTNFLPIDVASQNRVLVFMLSDDGDFFGNKNTTFDSAVEKLKAEGFEVDVFDPKKYMMRDVKFSISSLKDNYDFALYLSNIKPASNKTTLRINWARPMGMDAPWFSPELPTVFVSFGNPYHLIDVPKVPTYINAYTASEATIEAVIDRILGKKEFKGKSPVDAFLGRFDTRL